MEESAIEAATTMVLAPGLMQSRVTIQLLLCLLAMFGCRESKINTSADRELMERMIGSQLKESRIYLIEDGELTIAKTGIGPKYCNSISVGIMDSAISIARDKNDIIFRKNSIGGARALYWTCNPPLPPGDGSGRGSSYPVPDSLFTLQLGNQAAADSVFRVLNRLRGSR